MQAKRRMRSPHLTAAQGSGAKSAPAAAFQRLFAESLRGQVAGGLHARPPPFHETPRPPRLALEAPEGRLDDFRGDSRRSRSCRWLHRRSPAPRGSRPGSRKAGVVDEPGAGENGERLFHRGRSHRSRASRSAMPRSERSCRRSARPATASASARRSSWRRRRRAGRSSARPSASPARTTTSTGSVRHGAPSNSTATRPRPSSRSRVTVGTTSEKRLSRSGLSGLP